MKTTPQNFILRVMSVGIGVYLHIRSVRYYQGQKP